MGDWQDRGALTGRRYLDSLDDGREVWLDGERIARVANHPALAGMAQTLAGLYDRQHVPEFQEQMTFVVPELGVRASRSYLRPRSAEELLSKRRNSEIWAAATAGMLGRYPDFCANIVVGLWDLRERLAESDPRFGANVEAYYRHCLANDLCLTHALVDPQIDRSKRPSQDPDLSIQVVRETDAGVVVRGARGLATLAPLSHEVLVYPFLPPLESEREFAIWFALPVATPGLRLLCREAYPLGKSRFDHPLASRFDEMDAMVILDDVLVPWERVFLLYDARRSAELQPQLMPWAGYSSQIRLLAKVELLCGVACLLAETIGIDDRLHVQERLGELLTYYDLLRLGLRGAEADARATPGGLVRPGEAACLRNYTSLISARLIEIVEEIGTSGLVMTPSERDLAQPELAPAIARYFRGKNVEAADRIKLFKLAWDLVGDSFGSRQQLYERLHAGDPTRNRALAYLRYDKEPLRQRVWQLLADES